jgi:hypothetical protein
VSPALRGRPALAEAFWKVHFFRFCWRFQAGAKFAAQNLVFLPQVIVFQGQIAAE